MAEDGRFRPRWYMQREADLPQGKVQVEDRIRTRHGKPYTLPEELLRLAQDEYDIQFPGQPYERMQERGGLGIGEVVRLLADALERERAK